MMATPLTEQQHPMEIAHLLLDTNILMHFRRINEIDWTTIAGADECRLLIAPVVIRELEKHKVQHSSAKLRDRAGEIISYLVGLAGATDGATVIRQGATLDFLDHEPLLDFAQHRLSREIADDQLIASAIELGEAYENVSIVSNDAGLGIKLRSRPVGLVRLPEELRLPSAEDAERKEIRDLRQQLARLQSRLPKLEVSFADGSTLIQMERIQRDVKDLPTLQEMKNRFQPMSLPQYRTRAGALSSMAAFALRQEDIDGYNAQREVYLSNYVAFLEDHRCWQDRMGRLFDLNFSLRNIGSGPATNVDVDLKFPKGITFIQVGDWPKPPKEPKPPRRPERRFEDFLRGTDMLGPARLSPFTLPNVHGINDGDPMFEEGSNLLTYAASSLKHECNLELASVIVEIPQGGWPAAIPVTAAITCNEAQRVEQTLTVKFLR
jgi:rRNA-processing protein FCF1